MPSSSAPFKNEFKKRFIGSLLAGGLALGALFGSRVARAEVRTTPQAGCTIPVSTNMTTFWVGGPPLTTNPTVYGAGFRQIFWLTGDDKNVQCPVNTDNSFVPARFYIDFTLFSQTTVSASVRRTSYDGKTIEDKPLISGTYAGGMYDVGATVSFATISPWDYLIVSTSGLRKGDLTGIGYSN